MAELLKERTEMDPAYMWKLGKMYESDEAWEADLASVQDEPARLAAYKGTLNTSENVKKFYDDITELFTRIDKIYCYASLRSSEDTRQEKAKSMNARAMSLFVAVSTALSFADPELLALPQETFDEIASSPELADYSVLLKELADQRPHTLTTAEERIIASYGEVLSAPGTITSSLENADMQFAPAVDSEGQEHELTGSNFVLLQMQEDRELRKSAFENYYKGFQDHINTFADAYSANVKRETVSASLRHYPSSREMAAARERVPGKVYENLIASVRRHMPDMYRYVRLRRKLLGVDELHFYDIYAPLAGPGSHRYSFEEAQQMLLEATAPLGQEYVSTVRQGLAEGWVDVYPNKGKRGGAFSGGCYLSDPYILMNFTGSLDSVSTLVHEMGHSMHSWYSRQNQPAQYSDYTIFVAEVASTVNENLLIERLLETETDKTARLALLNQYLENFKGTVFRQTMFAEFEKEAHEMAESGQALTPQALCDLYGRLVEDYFGPDMVIDDQIRYEWARIPHFYRPFYVYKYATSYSAAVTLSEGIRAEYAGKAEGNVKRYLEFLSMGCSQDPLDELAHAGVDLSQEAAIDVALDKFARVLDEAEALIG